MYFVQYFNQFQRIITGSVLTPHHGGKEFMELTKNNKCTELIIGIWMNTAFFEVQKSEVYRHLQMKSLVCSLADT